MRLASSSIHRWFAHFTGLSGISYQLMHGVGQTFQDAHVMVNGMGKIRRFLLVHFRQKYVRQQMRIRGGECRQCGVCCNLLYACPMLTKNRRCLIYGLCRPMACRTFPIDQRDIDEVGLNSGHCGYCFDRRQHPQYPEREPASES